MTGFSAWTYGAAKDYTDANPGQVAMRTAVYPSARAGASLPSRAGMIRSDADYIKEMVYESSDPDTGVDQTANVQNFLMKAYLTAVSLKNQAYDDILMRNRVRVIFPRGKYPVSSPIIIPEYVDVHILGDLLRLWPPGGGNVTTTYTGDTSALAFGNIYQPTLIVGGKSVLSCANVYCNPDGVALHQGSGVFVGKNWTTTATAVSAAGTGYTIGDVLTGAIYARSPYVGLTATVATVNGSGGVTGITWTTGGAYPLPIVLQQQVWTAANGFSVFDPLNADAYQTTGGTGTGCTLTVTWRADFVSNEYDGGQAVIGDDYVNLLRVHGCGENTDGTFGQQSALRYMNLNHELGVAEVVQGQVGLYVRSASDLRIGSFNGVLCKVGVSMFSASSIECPNVVLDSCTSASVVIDSCQTVRLAGDIFFATENAAANQGAPSTSGYQLNIGQFSSSTKCNNLNLDFDFTNAGRGLNPGSPLMRGANTRGSRFRLNVRNSTRTSSTITGPYQVNRIADLQSSWETSNTIEGAINNTLGTLFGNAVLTATFAANPTNGQTLTLGGTVITFVTSGATGDQVNIGGTPSTTATSLGTLINNNQAAYRMRASVSSTVVTIESFIGGVAGNAVTASKSGTNPGLSGATFSGGVEAPACDVRIWDDSVGGYCMTSGVYQCYASSAPAATFGQNKLPKMSTVTDIVGGNTYINTGDQATPVWKQIVLTLTP